MLTQENFDSSFFRWRDRQAGISVIYDPDREQYSYNAFCIEAKVVKELFSCEFEFLDDALELVNAEYGNWELAEYDTKKGGCGSCVAK